MPVRRLNFTNRSKLTREQANVRVHPGQPATFEAVLDLSHLVESAGSARVFVEAYHRTTRMRFAFGTVAKLTPPSHVDSRLTEFPDWKDISFRVKVTDISGNSPGRIIAWANNIRPKAADDDEQKDLVRWKDDDLNGLLWDLEFDEKGPVVRIEKAIGHGSVGQDPRFIAVAYPEILRRSLTQALLVEKVSVDDTEHWFFSWKQGYLKGTLGLTDVPEGADSLEEIQIRTEWIEQAVSAFGRQFKLADQWQSAVEAKGAE